MKAGVALLLAASAEAFNATHPVSEKTKWKKKGVQQGKYCFISFTAIYSVYRWHLAVTLLHPFFFTVMFNAQYLQHEPMCRFDDKLLAIITGPKQIITVRSCWAVLHCLYNCKNHKQKTNATGCHLAGS